MGAITVANKDWAAIEDVADALAAATINSETVFGTVAVTTAEAQLREVQLTGPQPRAVIRYVGTDYSDAAEETRTCAVAMEIHLAARLAPNADQRDRLTAALRLVNAAINAVETDPPDDAIGIGGGGKHRPGLQWRRPTIDASESAPWVLAVLPLTVNLTLDAGGRH